MRTFSQSSLSVYCLCLFLAVINQQVSSFLNKNKLVYPKAKNLGKKMTATTMEFNIMSLSKLQKILLRVENVDLATKFYCSSFGLQEIGPGILAFQEGFTLEFIQSKLIEPAEGFDSVQLSTPDVQAMVAKAVAAGGRVLMDTQEVQLGPSMVPDEPVEKKTNITMAVLSDPSGIKVVLVEAPSPSLSKVSLKVSNLEKMVEFCEALGMTLLRKRSLLPKIPAIVGTVGYGSEEDPTIELIYKYGTEKIKVGTQVEGLQLSTLDLVKGMESLTAAGYEHQSETNKVVSTKGPDGHVFFITE